MGREVSDPVSTLGTVAGDSVTFRLEGELTLDKLSHAVERFRDVLAALEQDQAAHVRWVLAGLEYGSAVVTARAEPLDEEAVPKIPRMTEMYLIAGQQVSAGDLDDARPLLRVVRGLTELADERNRVILETAEDEVIFTAPIQRLALGQPRPQSRLGPFAAALKRCRIGRDSGSRSTNSPPTDRSRAISSLTTRIRCVTLGGTLLMSPASSRGMPKAGGRSQFGV